MTKAEQETVIRWDREEQLVDIWSADAVIWRRLARLGVAVRKETTHKGEITGRCYVPIALELFRFGVKRERTEAQRAAARKAGEKLAAAKKLLGADGANRDSETDGR